MMAAVMLDGTFGSEYSVPQICLLRTAASCPNLLIPASDSSGQTCQGEPGFDGKPDRSMKYRDTTEGLRPGA
jgi:hypothetical protein